MPSAPVASRPAGELTPNATSTNNKWGGQWVQPDAMPWINGVNQWAPSLRPVGRAKPAAVAAAASQAADAKPHLIEPNRLIPANETVPLELLSQPSRSRGSADSPIAPKPTRISPPKLEEMRQSRSLPDLGARAALDRDSSRASLQNDLLDNADSDTEGMPDLAWPDQPVPPAPDGIDPPERRNKTDWSLGCFDRHMSRDTCGNAGFYYANFGKRAHNTDIQESIDAQLKRNPALMMFFSEMPAETERILQLPPRPTCPTLHQNAAVAAFYKREELQWCTIRQDDTHGDPCCIAVRQEGNPPARLKLLADHTVQDGKHPKTKAPVYTRILVCEAHLPEKLNVGYLGQKIVGICAHLHHLTAKGHQGFHAQKERNFDMIADLAKKHGAVLLAADVNMSMCIVPTELRKRGVPCVTAACYPYQAGRRRPCLDSCGIWILNIEPVEARLCLPLSSVRDQDDLDEWETHNGDTRMFEYFPAQSGPGQEVHCYLPKNTTLQARFKLLLKQPCETKADLVAAALARDRNESTRIGLRDTQPADACRWLRTTEKRLTSAVWAHNGAYHGGAHFPLMVYTSNLSRRSERAYTERQNSKRDKYQRKVKTIITQKRADARQRQEQTDALHPREQGSRASSSAQPQYFDSVSPGTSWDNHVPWYVVPSTLNWVGSVVHQPDTPTGWEEWLTAEDEQ